jgi:hypothetical protein
MNITKVKYQPNCSITGEASTTYIATIDGEEMIVPADTGNRHYQAIQKWIADGGTVIDNGGGE